jgi:gas vesicle protein
MKSSFIFLAGVGLGIVVGLLVAPEPGKATLRKVKAEADRIVDKVVQRRVQREAHKMDEVGVVVS